MKSISIKRLSPRNPFAMLGLKRRAGRHGLTGGAQRLAARRSLAREVAQIPWHPPSS